MKVSGLTFDSFSRSMVFFSGSTTKAMAPENISMMVASTSIPGMAMVKSFSWEEIPAGVSIKW